MLVKRYRAKDMQEAMDTVIRELGSDAVILSNRKVRKKGLRYLFQKPLQEVMVAYDPAKIPIAKKINSAYSAYIPKPQPEEKGDDRLQKAVEQNKEQIAIIDSRIETLDRMLGGFIDKFAFVKREITYDYAPEVEELLALLIGNQVREELAHMLARETEQILKKQQGARAKEVLEHLILEELGESEPIHPKKFNQTVVLVLGPTGVGKTTTIVKLAANFSVNLKKKVGIVNTDTYRIAAQEQLNTYSDILDIPLSVIYQANEIGQTLKDMQDREIIFIDTAGKCRRFAA
jgi:flagellar biosynthesis protein FlhF